MHNPNSRLEAFCDGVFAIALTLLVIELKVPVENIQNSSDLWSALKHMLPEVFAFLLSFGIVLITWANHHSSLKLIDKSSPQLLYANGFLLLTVVFIPFPSALLGEYILTESAAPAVVLYTAINAVQAIAWNVMSRVVLKQNLTRSEKAKEKAQDVYKKTYFAIALYTICSILALWFPLTFAIVITIIWIFWLIYGINIKDE